MSDRQRHAVDHHLPGKQSRSASDTLASSKRAKIRYRRARTGCLSTGNADARRKSGKIAFDRERCVRSCPSPQRQSRVCYLWDRKSRQRWRSEHYQHDDPDGGEQQCFEDFHARLAFPIRWRAERHMPGRDMAARRLHVDALVVEKISARKLQERAFVQSAQNSFVDADVPARSVRTTRSWAGALRAVTRAVRWARVRREFGLDPMQRREKTLEGLPTRVLWPR